MNDEVLDNRGAGAAHAARAARQGRHRRRRSRRCSARRRRRSARARPPSIKVAVVTHGDTGSFWSVFKKGVDQAAKDLKSPRRQRHAGLREQRRRRSRSRGINAAIAAGAKVIATSVPDASALKDPLTKASAKGIEIITVNSGLGAFDSLPTYEVHVGQTEDVAGQGAGKQFKKAGAKKVLIVIHEASNSGLQQRADGREVDPRRRRRQGADDPEREVGHPGHEGEGEGGVQGRQDARRLPRPRSRTSRSRASTSSRRERRSARSTSAARSRRSRPARCCSRSTSSSTSRATCRSSSPCST